MWVRTQRNEIVNLETGTDIYYDERNDVTKAVLPGWEDSVVVSQGNVLDAIWLGNRNFVKEDIDV